MLRLVDLLENVVMIGCFAAALALGLYQVILRYVFSTGYQWLEGTIILFTVWAALFGGSRAIRDRMHARVGVLVDGLPPRPRQAINLLVITLTLGYLLAMLVFGWQFVTFLHDTGQRSLRVQIPTWQVFAVVPVFLTFYVVRYLAEFANVLREPRTTLSTTLTEEVSQEYVEERKAAMQRASGEVPGGGPAPPGEDGGTGGRAGGGGTGR